MMRRPLNSSSFNIQECLKTHEKVITRKSRRPTQTANDDDLFSPQMKDRSLDAQTVESGSSLAAMSVTSSSMIQNSLFHLRDYKSIDNYMAQIMKNETTRLDEHTPGAMVNHADFLTKALHKGKQFEIAEDALHFSIRCNNLSSWNVDTYSVRIRNVNFRLIQTIIFRESILLRLKDLLENLEKCYWKYSAQRIRDTAAEKSLHSEALVLKRNHIFSLQNELSVGIAHLRSLSITVVDFIQRLRHLIESELQLSASVSIYWKEENYLLKMIKDCDFFFDFPACRYWLGFVPNALMIPPPGHNPLEKWRNHCSGLLKMFLDVQKEKQIKVPQKAARRKGSVVHEKRDSLPSFVTNALPTNITEVRVTAPEDEWRQLRDYCVQSWTFDSVIHQCWPETTVHTDTENWVQSAQNAFFRDTDHNPLVVEAALGFSEIFPSIFLVPPLPTPLLAHCLRQQHVLFHERERCDQLKELRYTSTAKAEAYHESISTMDEATMASASEGDESVKQLRRLRHRQQGDNQSLQGLSTNYVSSCYASLKLPSQDSAGASRFDDETFHLTLPDFSRSLDHPSLAEAHGLLDTSLFPSFLIENASAHLRNALQQRVDDSRKIVVKPDRSSGIFVRADRKGRRELSRLDQEWLHIHAISIQRVFRGHQSRSFVHSLKTQRKWKTAVLVIQTVCRRMLAKARFRRRQRDHKIETFLLRKSAIHRFRAAVIITKFIRRVVNQHRLLTQEPLLFDRLDLYGRRLSRSVTVSRLHEHIHANQSHSISYPPLLKDDNVDHASNDEENDSLGTSSKVSFVLSQQGDVSLLSLDDVEKQKFDRMQALALIERVNRGKVAKDSRRSCRLIPHHDSVAGLPRKKFSKKSLLFMSDGQQGVTTVQSTKDVYVHPRHLENSKSLPLLSSSESLSQAKISFVDHLTLKEEKRKQRELKDSEQVRSVISKYFS